MKRSVQIGMVWGNIVGEMSWSRPRGLHCLGGKVKTWKGFWGCIQGINFGEFSYGSLSFPEIDDSY